MLARARRLTPFLVAFSLLCLCALVGCEAVLGLNRLGDQVTEAEAGSSPEAGADASTAGAIDGAGPDAAAPDSAGSPESSVAPCDDDASPGSCVSFVPSGGLDRADLSRVGLADFVLPGPGDAGPEAGAFSILFDVDTGEITLPDGGVLRPATTSGDLAQRDVQEGIAYRQTATHVAVFTFGALTVPAGTTLAPVGQLPVAIASASTLEVDGVIDARGNACNGRPPGGYAGGAGGCNGDYCQAGPTLGSGPGAGSAVGSGGGHAGLGGNPAPCEGGASCGGGGVYDTPDLGDGGFHGGSGGAGGNAGGHNEEGGYGGQGGGAIRVVAATAITMGFGPQLAGVNASGCAGTGGLFGTATGGGGGAGGAIVIEAPSVRLGPMAGILAGGGGGGGGNALAGGWSPSFSLARNQSIPADPNPVPTIVGAGCNASYYTSGPGTGGNLGSAAGTSGDPTLPCAGGGGAGWIRVNSQDASPNIDVAAIFSPDSASQAMTVGGLVPVH